MGLLDNNNFRMSVDRNPYAQSPKMTPEEYKAAMTDFSTPARFKPENKNRSFFSPSLVPGEGTYTDPYTGMQRKQGSNIDFFKTGDEIQTLRKEALAKEKAFGESSDTVESTLPDKEESLLPDPKLKGKSFMDKLNKATDAIFNMQENNPEAYRKMMSGIDLYSRSQTQDLATALLGNNKFNKDQATALMQSNMNAMNYKMTVAKFDQSKLDALKVDMPSEELTKLAQSRLKNEYDIKDENQGYALASKAMKELQKNPGLTQPEALTLAIMRAVENGELKSGKGKFGKGEFKSMIDVEITTQAEYDALPSGAIFTQPGVGRRRKP